tara:strand:+ start:82 stop:243 length:162 start_codon:yes stop_codon:yes gene_type:complete
LSARKNNENDHGENRKPVAQANSEAITIRIRDRTMEQYPKVGFSIHSGLIGVK